MIKPYWLTRSEIRGISWMSLFIILIKGITVFLRIQIEHVQAPDMTVQQYSVIMQDNRGLQIEINTADTSDWINLSGIGPVIASRIIRYRELLGGFYSLEQLKEVYGIDSVLFRKIKPNLKLETGPFIFLDVNSASFKELLRHPYLEYEIVKDLCNYRDRHGPLTQTGVLHTAGVIPDSVWQRVNNYLSAGSQKD